MTRSYYTAQSLEAELRAFETRFGIGSEDFISLYRSDGVPDWMPYFEGFVWADTYTELCRLRAAQPQFA